MSETRIPPTPPQKNHPDDMYRSTSSTVILKRLSCRHTVMTTEHVGSVWRQCYFFCVRREPLGRCRVVSRCSWASAGPRATTTRNTLNKVTNVCVFLFSVMLNKKSKRPQGKSDFENAAVGLCFFVLIQRWNQTRLLQRTRSARLISVDPGRALGKLLRECCKIQCLLSLAGSPPTPIS